ncbi:DUF2207 domain-containing protein [Cryobacterium sp. BB307]|uniref:DUF2207 domain-containing protein n=1 Tax=Cryobacterium sp. BB307 TaxID=2716317 RepID=UPI00144586F3|nr:DUF2207 domain-containing protein [Cryobacterium sp. BB307]
MEAWLRSHGGRRLRVGLRTFWALVAVAGVVLLVGPVINKPLTLDDITNSARNATDRWIARDFAVDYRISRTPEGALVSQVEERISAFFPEDTRENGIQRVLATQYQSHALTPQNIEATLDGERVPVGRSSTPDQLTLTLNGPERLQGDHEFVLRYQLHHLAYPTTDSASDQPVELLEWDVFGLSWPQGFAGLDVQITLPEDLDDSLIRQPRGSLAWSMLSAGEWLTAEPGASGDVTYRFVNDQRIPPNAQAWFTMSFEPGTFTMPAPSPLYWLQVFGPLLPLAFLAVTLLLALAARAVAWSDVRGRPWYVVQTVPPTDVTPRMAAQILRATAAMELAEALRASQAKQLSKREQRERLVAAAKVARRTGRVGDLPRALSRYLSAAERRDQFSAGFRRVPHGLVRDLFIAAPIALTFVQWGLIRQLSYQPVLAVLWWPVAFVLISSVVAAIVLWIALSSRPLTRRGALVKQHLLGIREYARRTQLLDRSAPSERLLPYAVLLAEPRAAGASTVARIEAGLGESGVSSRWRIREYLTWPRLIIRALSLIIVAGAIGAVALLPNPYPQSVDRASYSGDVPGTLWTKVNSLEATAQLSRTDDGHARLDVIERLDVSFTERGSRVPQFAQQWPNRLNGQDLGLRVESVQIDDRDVPFATQQEGDTLLLRTTLVEVVNGEHEVRIEYTLASAAVAAQQGSEIVDRVRWAALLDGWEWNSGWGADPVPDPLRIEFRMADELAALATTGGWISKDTESAERARDWQPSVVPFNAVAAPNPGDSHALELKQDEFGGWPLEFTVDDVGTRVDFPAGTFAGTDDAALRVSQVMNILPVILVATLAAIGLALGLAGASAGFTRRARAFDPGSFRDLVWWLAPAATLAALILFVWASSDMPTDHSAFPLLVWPTLAALIASPAGLILTRSTRYSRRSSPE